MGKVETVDQDQQQQLKTEVGQTSAEEALVNLEKSQGVARIEALSTSFTKVTLFVLLLGIFLVTYAYGLDSQTRNVYQTYATDQFGKHSLLSTLLVVQSVAAAVIQPPLSIATNVFGRFELVSFAAVLYVVGTVVEACSKNVETYGGGQVLWTVGLRAFQLLFEIVLADVSSLRNRVLFSYIPGLPYIINTWISGNVTSTVLANSSWEWGIGMWAIIIPVTTIPIFVSLFLVTRKAKRQGKLDNIQSIYTGKTLKEKAILFFWQFDLVGIILISGFLCLLLIPLTIAGGVAARWRGGDIISMLVIGFVCIPAFVIWESKFAKYPCIPFHLLKNRVILACLIIALLFNACWYLQGGYLLTVLMVSFNETNESATRIYSLYSFTAVVCGYIAGFIIRYIRRLKWIAVFGTFMYLLGLGLMIKYRSSVDGITGLIAAQVVLGIGGGFFSYPVQALIQAEIKHEHVAIITAIYLTTYRVGAAIGSSVSGAIWSNTLPSKLTENFASFSNSTNLIKDAYGSPLTFIKSYPMNSPERLAIIDAYNYTQRLLTITGCCMAVPLVLAALTLRNPLVGDERFLPNAEEENNNDKAKAETKADNE
ncbi:major facilitator superfamily transporter, partial [Cunninghamella echinulata]